MVFENNDLLNEAAVNVVIPSYVTSLTEAAMFVSESIENDYNRMFESIGVNELAVYESTGSMIVYEDGENGKTGPSFKDRILQWLQGVWGKIKGFFEKVIESISKRIAAAVANFAKLDGKDLAKIPDDKQLGVIYEIVNPDYSSKFSQYSMDLAGKYNEDLSIDDIKELNRKINEELFARITGDNNVKSISDMKKAITASYMKEENKIVVTGAYFKKNYSTIQKNALDKNLNIEAVKSLYTSSKTCIDNLMSVVKKSKGEDKTATAKLNGFKDLVHILNQLNAACINGSKKVRFEYMSVLGKGIMAAGKKAKMPASDEPKDNKSEGDQEVKTESTQMQVLESLFDF